MVRMIGQMAILKCSNLRAELVKVTKTWPPTALTSARVPFSHSYHQIPFLALGLILTNIKIVGRPSKRYCVLESASAPLFASCCKGIIETRMLSYHQIVPCNRPASNPPGPPSMYLPKSLQFGQAF